MALTSDLHTNVHTCAPIYMYKHIYTHTDRKAILKIRKMEIMVDMMNALQGIIAK